MGPRRASTFPESMPNNKRTALPLSQAHLANLGVDPTHNTPSHSGPDYFEPAPSLTPTSATASSLSGYGMAVGPNSQQRPAQSFPATPLANTFADPSGLNVPLTDISTMMFPSADPMAYPNQPMTTFEDNHPQAFGFKHGSPSITQMPYQVTGVDIKPNLAAFSPGGMATVQMGPRRPDNEVQLFGPMPMYLMQGAQPRAFHPQQASQSAHMTGHEGTSMSLDDLFSGEEWAQAFMDQSLGLNGPNTGFGSNPHFGPGGPGMSTW